MNLDRRRPRVRREPSLWRRELTLVAWCAAMLLYGLAISGWLR